MLKKVLNHIDKEINQAKDYIECAFSVKHDYPTLGDLYLELGKEEIVHAEKLMHEGESLSKTMQSPEHMECLAVWKWMKEKHTECINDLQVKINRYRSY